MSSDSCPTIPPYDSQLEEVISPAAVLASLMTPPSYSPRAESEETEPFEEDEVAYTPVISPAIPTPLRASASEAGNDTSDSESSNTSSQLLPPLQPTPIERRGSATIFYTRKRLRVPTAPIQPPPAPPSSPISPTSPLQMMSQSPPLSPRRSMPPPTVFYYQTTTVPLSPLVQSHSATPSLSGSHIENTAEDARARRHEAHTNEITVLNDEMPLERLQNIEGNLGDLVHGRMAMDEVFKLVKTRLQEASEAIAGLERGMEEGRQETRELREIAAITQDINEQQAEELAAAHTRILALEYMLAESQAREVDRDKRIEELTEVVRSLQRKIEDPPGNV